MKTIVNTPRQENWLKNKAGTTPASTQIHPEFQKLLASGKFKMLDAGCGNGRIASQLAKQGHRITGIDINKSEILHARSLYPKIQFHVEDAGSLSFENEAFDHVITLGLFGGVDRQTRSSIFLECFRVLKPGGYIYLGEFARILDPTIRTSKGSRWIDVYKDDMSITGEYGSVVVRPENPKKSFVAHHFAEADLISLAMQHNFQELTMKRVFTVSMISGEKRPNWNAWFKKAA